MRRARSRPSFRLAPGCLAALACLLAAGCGSGTTVTVVSDFGGDDAGARVAISAARPEDPAASRPQQSPDR